MALIKCKECGNENAQDAATCPKCGKRLKMGIVKKLGLGVLGFIVFLVVVGAIAGSDKNAYTGQRDHQDRTIVIAGIGG